MDPTLVATLQGDLVDTANQGIAVAFVLFALVMGVTLLFRSIKKGAR